MRAVAPAKSRLAARILSSRPLAADSYSGDFGAGRERLGDAFGERHVLGIAGERPLGETLRHRAGDGGREGRDGVRDGGEGAVAVAVREVAGGEPFGGCGAGGGREILRGEGAGPVERGGAVAGIEEMAVDEILRGEGVVRSGAERGEVAGLGLFDLVGVEEEPQEGREKALAGRSEFGGFDRFDEHPRRLVGVAGAEDAVHLLVEGVDGIFVEFELGAGEILFKRSGGCGFGFPAATGGGEERAKQRNADGWTFHVCGPFRCGGARGGA